MKRQRREFLGVLGAVAGSALMSSPLAFGEQVAAGDGAKETVAGIGGFFFRAKDPKALAQWYQEHLGVFVIPKSASDPVWKQEAGPTAFAPFSEKTTYFDVTKPFMLNFRVRNLDRMAAQLEAVGIAVKVDSETYPNGRFAHLSDPEGNPIELWEPK